MALQGDLAVDSELRVELKSKPKPKPERDPQFRIQFADDDPRDPRNWPILYRAFVIFVMSFSCTTVVLYGTAYTASLAGVMEYFGITRVIATLGLTVFLLGMAVGCLFAPPLSELYGRKPVYLISMSIFVITVLPTALAKNYASILIPRFISGTGSAAFITITAGSVNDVVRPKYRALAISIWSTGPVIGGFVFQYLGWRWISWLTLILNGASLVFLVLCRETYAPTILSKMAAKKRKETQDERWWSDFDRQGNLGPILRESLSRPIQFLFTEPICIFWDLYVGLVYGVLYLCFVAYPVVFQQERGWSPSMGGLSFLGIGIGTLFTIGSEPYIRRYIQNSPKDPLTGKPFPEAAAAVVSVGGVLLAVGQIIFAWTSRREIHWAYSMSFGSMLFGAGNAAVFVYSSSYLVGAYGNYSASALAGAAVVRSILGACLPLAGPKMYQSLGSTWASFTLGLIELVAIPVPFIFWRYGPKIRSASRVITSMENSQY